MGSRAADLGLISDVGDRAQALISGKQAAVEDIAASMGTLLLPCNTMSRSQAPDNRGEMWLGAGRPPQLPLASPRPASVGCPHKTAGRRAVTRHDRDGAAIRPCPIMGAAVSRPIVADCRTILKLTTLAGTRSLRLSPGPSLRSH
jgi:hypothetical protein